MELQLKAIRKKKRVTQVELAKMMAVDTKTVGNWELGKTIMSAEQLWNCAVALDTDPNTLMGWPDDRPEAQRRMEDVMDTLSPEGQEVAVNVVGGLAATYPKGDGQSGVVERTA